MRPFCILVATMTTLMACGKQNEELLHKGRYDITIIYLASDWGEEPGNRSEAEWIIDNKGSEYTIQVVETSWEFKGYQEDESLWFYIYRDIGEPKDDCQNYNRLDIILHPHESGKQFNGTGYSKLHLCRLSSCRFPSAQECETSEADIEETASLIGRLIEK